MKRVQRGTPCPECKLFLRQHVHEPGCLLCAEWVRQHGPDHDEFIRQFALERSRELYRRDPKRREKNRQYVAAWRARNPERARELSRQAQMRYRQRRGAEE